MKHGAAGCMVAHLVRHTNGEQNQTKSKMTQQPRNLTGVEFYEIDEITVYEYHPLPNGEGEPTQVHLSCKLVGGPAAFVIRMKSGRPIDELIVSLITHRKRVFGSADTESDKK